MTRLDKEDLAQMTRDYFQSLDKESLVEVAFNLRSLAVEQWEKLQQNSENSSKPPSSDNPYSNPPTTDEKRESQESELSQEKEKNRIKCWNHRPMYPRGGNRLCASSRRVS